MSRTDQNSRLNPNPVKIIVAAVVAVLVLIGIFECITVVEANEITVKQAVDDGEYTVWVEPGPKGQFFGRTTSYQKSAEFSFLAPATKKVEVEKEGKKSVEDVQQDSDAKDMSIRARFNDGGHGNISGTLRFELPLDRAKMVLLHEKFHSQEAIAQQLIRPAVERAVYMSGPLMTSKESAAERRSDLLQYIEDQMINGVYRTTTRDEKVLDPISGKERTVTKVELVKDPTAPNGIARQEGSPLGRFGVRAYSFTINGISYDENVEGQIKQQQDLAMRVTTAIAEARSAEQRAITVEQEGRANAAKAKWEQEVIKAKEVTKADQEKAVAVTGALKEKEVAELKMQSAEFYRQEQIKRGEGEAKRAELVMQANGALEQKLEAWKAVNLAYAAEFGKQKWVPEVMVTSGDGRGNNPAGDLMQFLQIKAARDLGLDMGMRK